MLVGCLPRELAARLDDLRTGEFGEEGLQDDVEDWDEEEVEDGGQDHAADDGSADRVTTVSACAGGEVQRANAEDEGDRGHEDGAKTKLGGLDSSLGDRPALPQELLGELDDKDGVFRRETD